MGIARILLLGAIFSIGFAPLTRSAELIMVEEAGCIWCARWNAEISDIYPKTDEGRQAPLRRVDLNDLPADIDFVSRPVFTPTFVLVQDGQELGRLEGYNGDEFFWFLLNRLLENNADRIN